jgi:hypothetical protein
MDKIICPSCGGTGRRHGQRGDYVCTHCAAIIRGPGWSIEVAGHDASEVEKVASGLFIKAAGREGTSQARGDDDMDIATATSVITTATAAVSLFDKVADQVVRFIRKDSAPPGPLKEHRLTIRGAGNELKVEAHGRTVQVLRGEDLKNLPADYYQHIKTLEASVRRYYDVWQQVYPHRDDGDLVTNAKVNNQLRDLALKMKDDLAGIIDFLQSIGVGLDDHYMIYRDVIRRYAGDA